LAIIRRKFGQESKGLGPSAPYFDAIASHSSTVHSHKSTPPAKILHMIQQPFDQPTHDLRYVSTLFLRALLSQSTLELTFIMETMTPFIPLPTEKGYNVILMTDLKEHKRVLRLLCLLGLLSRSNIQQKSTTTKTDNHQYVLSENLNHLTSIISPLVYHIITAGWRRANPPAAYLRSARPPRKTGGTTSTRKTTSHAQFSKCPRVSRCAARSTATTAPKTPAHSLKSTDG
jgi:hypothetical protein